MRAPDKSLQELWRETIGYTNANDSLMDQLEARVIALEEILAAPWPRRWILARRYRRQMRASVRPFEDWPDIDSWRWARLENVTNEWLSEGKP